MKMAPVLSEIFTSDTSDFATLFTNYLRSKPPPLEGQPLKTQRAASPPPSTDDSVTKPVSVTQPENVVAKPEKSEAE